MLEDEVRDDGEHHEGYALLDDLQLYEIEWSAIAIESNAVGGHLTTIFKQSDAPRKDDDTNQRPIV